MMLFLVRLLPAIILPIILLIIAFFAIFTGDLQKTNHEQQRNIFGNAEKNHEGNDHNIAMERIETLVDNSYQGFDAISKGYKENIKKEIKKIYNIKHELKPEIVLEDITGKMKYEGGPRLIGYCSHFGQRKLFLSEIQFITNYCPPNEAAIIVYAGAAPNNKGKYLSDLFPNVTFLFVDPNPFDIHDIKHPRILYKNSTGNYDNLPTIQENINMMKIVMESIDISKKFLANRNDRKMLEQSQKRDKIFIINDIFTEHTAHACLDVFGGDNTSDGVIRHGFYFISDIRTNVSSGEESPAALDITWNLAQQFNWMRIMKARQSMLKFRHPFYTDDDARSLDEGKLKMPYKHDFDEAKKEAYGIPGIDFVENAKKRKLIYWSGTVYLQVWPGRSSTESRLVTDSKTFQEYKLDDYEDRYDYYNKICRRFGFYENENANKDVGFDHCADCAKENFIWKEYLRVYGKTYSDNPIYHNVPVIVLVNTMTKYSRHRFLTHEHGHVFKKMDALITEHPKGYLDDPGRKKYAAKKEAEREAKKSQPKKGS